ncbi:unnamed protein product [marine sediment metagenome]|uniref:Amidohydrolase-related domain-containing protein n=1 Tax=marine sediment metagenome TaxID=412755 RepID=X1D242_9ZZZZ
MIIDAHVILRDNKHMEEVVDSARKNGIDKICTMSLGTPIPHWRDNPSPEEVRIGNNKTIRAMSDFPDEVIGFCYLNPLHRKSSLPELERCIKAGMQGIKLWVACKASDKKLHPIAKEAIRYDIPILQHAWNKVTGNRSGESTSEDVCILAERFPKLKIIAHHLTGAGYRGILEVKKYKNIFHNTSEDIQR